MKKIVIVFYTMLFLVACDTPIKTYLNSYVATYYDVEELYVRKYKDCIAVETGNRGFSPPANSIYVVNYMSKEDDKIQYDYLCVKHDDISYNRTIEMDRNMPTPFRSYMAADLASVDVSSDSDYNESHLMGASLNDIVIFFSVSPYPYIQSGYRTKYEWEKNNGIEELPDMGKYIDYQNTLHPIYKTVSELQPSELRLLGNGASLFLYGLKLDREPTLSQEHTFTITTTIEDGRIFMNHVYVNFKTGEISVPSDMENN